MDNESREWSSYVGCAVALANALWKGENGSHKTIIEIIAKNGNWKCLTITRKYLNRHRTNLKVESWCGILFIHRQELKAAKEGIKVFDFTN